MERHTDVQGRDGLRGVDVSKGISLHIGLNRVDPSKYDGWDGTLVACENDATAMAAIASANGFGSVKTLMTQSATRDAVVRAIRAAGESLKTGDIFFLSYSGHGNQVADTNGDEPDQKDETWVLFDRELVDDELYALWASFTPGVRVLILSDSCHSATVLREILPQTSTVPTHERVPASDARPGNRRAKVMPRKIREALAIKNAAYYEQVQASYPDGDRAIVGASVMLLAACRDNQTAADGDVNGLFTQMLLEAWDGGKFKGSYSRLYTSIVNRMPDNQSPALTKVGSPNVGSPNSRFEKQRPFSVE